MKKLLFSFLGCACSIGSAWAVDDSLGVKMLDGKYFIQHKVEKGEALYRLSKRYNVPVQKIEEANDGLKEGLKNGFVILVPTTKPEQNNKSKNTAKKPVYHNVEHGETLYQISQKFSVSVDEIKKWNSLNDNSISPGQDLIIAFKDENINSLKTSNPATIGVKPEDGYVDGKYKNEFKDFHEKLEERRKEGKTEWIEVREKGIAGWIDDGSVISDKSLALHRTAPPGTIIRLTNLMNNRSILIKVIGQLPKGTDSENVTVKITKTAADKLGVLDKYFRVDMQYGMEKVK